MMYLLTLEAKWTFIRSMLRLMTWRWTPHELSLYRLVIILIQIILRLASVIRASSRTLIARLLFLIYVLWLAPDIFVSRFSQLPMFLCTLLSNRERVNSSSLSNQGRRMFDISSNDNFLSSEPI